MSTTWSADADVYFRAPLVGDALTRVNSLRTRASVAVTTVDAYRVEAQRQILVALAGRGIAEADISYTAALLDPEALLAAALLFEAAAIRDDAVAGQVDVFSAQARTYRARFNTSLAAANPLGSTLRPTGRSFSWGRC